MAWAVPLHPPTPPCPHALSAHTQSQSGTPQGPEGPQELVQTTGDFGGYTDQALNIMETLTGKVISEGFKENC